MSFKIDLHVHSSNSFDSVSNISKIVKNAKKKGLHAICVTDHDVVSKFENIDSKIKIFYGCEISTDIGDLLAIFIKNEVKPGKWQNVVREVKAQGGVVILPHPYTYHKLSLEIIKLVDCIEVYNSRVNPELNRKAVELASKYSKPIVACSDAHFASDVGNSYTIIECNNLSEAEVKKALINGKTKVHYSSSNRKNVYINRMIKLVKLRAFNKVVPFIVKKVKQLIRV